MLNSPSKKDSFTADLFKKLPIVTALGFALSVPIAFGAQESRQIEEVIVTAERQEASIQDTSISITAFTGEMLDNFGIRNQEDLQNFVPATTIQPYDATIRGVGRNFRALGGDPGVATYMNEIYSEDLLTATAATFWDVERVEVLRGPQGTLYGRNAVGGAINILYKKPSQEFDYAVKAIGGNFDTKELYGMVNGKIIEDVLSGRFNFATRDRDGIIKDNGPGEDLDSLGTKNVALQLNFTPTDSLEFNIRANKMEIDRSFGGANGAGAVILNELNQPFRDTTHVTPGFRAIDTNNTDVANFLDQNFYDASEPILNFTDPATGANVQAQHNRAGIDLAEFSGFRNAAASMDGFNNTSAASRDRLNACVFPDDIDGDEVCVFTNGLNREEFDQQGVQFSTVWDVNDSLQLKYLYGYNKLSYRRTTDDDNTDSLFIDRQFYVNHEALYTSHEIQAFYDFGDNVSLTSGIFFYDSTIDQRGDFYSAVGEARFINGYQDNAGLAGAFFGAGPTATLHSARDRCQVANPAPSCAANFATTNTPLTNGVENNNLHIAQWYGDDGTNPDLNVTHGIVSQGSDLLYHTQTEKKAFSAYTQGVWDINDKFTLTLGVRYAEDEITAEENLFRYSEVAGGFLDSGALGLDLAVYNLLNGGIVPDPNNPGQFIPTELAVNGGIPVSLSVYRPFKRKDTEITWRANLDWNVTDNTLLYFSATTGTRAGGYNLVFFSQSATYEPEELIAYEIGYKTTFLDNTLQFFGSAYYYDYDTVHTVAVEVTPPLVAGGPTGTTTSTLAAPSARVYGVEVEAMWLATDSWTLGGNFSFTPSEYDADFLINSEGNLKTPESLFGDNANSLQENINGNQVVQVPEVKYTGWASYRWSLAGGSNVELFGVYSYTDEVYYSPFESESRKSAEYDRLDFRATWTSGDGNLIVSGFVNNILDELGQIQVLSEGEGENFRHGGTTTVPRLYGVEVTYALGQ
jgi:outer membrane receptor protein involved in Fe transport